mmetsp:Transcript_91523/g.254880  ORF Transcript_91523/g.254880 Transcript_91523/m.254880 type:complete len:335 (+) Transcript_91523:90-1094(+)
MHGRPSRGGGDHSLALPGLPRVLLALLAVHPHGVAEPSAVLIARVLVHVSEELFGGGALQVAVVDPVLAMLLVLVLLVSEVAPLRASLDLPQLEDNHVGLDVPLRSLHVNLLAEVGYLEPVLPAAGGDEQQRAVVPEVALHAALRQRADPVPSHVDADELVALVPRVPGYPRVDVEARELSKLVLRRRRAWYDRGVTAFLLDECLINIHLLPSVVVGVRVLVVAPELGARLAGRRGARSSRCLRGLRAGDAALLLRPLVAGAPVDPAAHRPPHPLEEAVVALNGHCGAHGAEALRKASVGAPVGQLAPHGIGVVATPGRDDELQQLAKDTIRAA